MASLCRPRALSVSASVTLKRRGSTYSGQGDQIVLLHIHQESLADQCVHMKRLQGLGFAALRFTRKFWEFYLSTIFRGKELYFELEVVK